MAEWPEIYRSDLQKAVDTATATVHQTYPQLQRAFLDPQERAKYWRLWEKYRQTCKEIEEQLAGKCLTVTNLDLTSRLPIEHAADENASGIPTEAAHVLDQADAQSITASSLQIEQQSRVDESLQKYVYQQLKDSKSFRILTLEPGEPTELLKCRLEISDIASAPVYRAVSYTWGSPTQSDMIICDRRLLKVTKNLRIALQRIRRSDKSVMVWVDGICINQEDKNERGGQVKLMQQIYGRARQVIIWLGPDEKKQAATAFSLAGRISRFVCGELQAPDSMPLPRDREWNSLAALFSQSWFWRLWVIQEAALADSALILWGDQETSWANIGVAAVWMRSVGYEAIDTKPMPGMYNAYLIWRISKEAGEDKAPTTSLLQLLRLTRQFGCSDPRDRVFALLGLANFVKHNGSSIEPDYTKSVQEVYQAVATRLLEEGGTLQVLSAVQHGPEVPHSISSWVPQWSQCFTQTISAEHEHNAANGLLNFQHIILDGKVLLVQGIQFDTAAIVTDVIPRYSDSGELDRMLLKLWLEVVRPLKTYPRNQGRQKTLGMAFYEALTAGKDWYGMPDVMRDGSQPGYGYFDFSQRWKLHWKIVTPHSEDGHGLSSSIPDNHLDEIRTWHALRHEGQMNIHQRKAEMFGNGCGNRRLFTTTRGYIGIGLAAMKAGDVVSVLAGGNVPFILRTRGEDWVLVGEVYVPGIMQGEAVKVAEEEGLSTEGFKIV